MITGIDAEKVENGKKLLLLLIFQCDTSIGH